MIRVFNFHIPTIFLAYAVLDVGLVYVIIHLATQLSAHGAVDIIPEFAHPTIQEVVFTIAVMTSLFSLGVYTRDCLMNSRELVARAAAALTTAFFLLIIIFYLFPHSRIWMSAMIPAMLAVPLCLGISHGLLRQFGNARTLKPRILVLGAGNRARAIEAVEHATGGARFVCAGFLPFGGLSLIDRRRVILENDLRRVRDILRPREIVIALEDSHNMVPVEILFECRQRGTKVTPFGTFLERETARIDVDQLDPDWLVLAGGGTKNALSRLAKRALDILVSATLLVLTLPATALVAAAIWLEDRGPIFYRQTRVGLYGRRFDIIKFRSMRTDAERDGNAVWATQRDPRVTRVGAFIRRVRLDELPQVVNVLRGHMSFVGPRPERPTITALIEKEVPYYDCRHLVKPGITGWAQINYGYGDSIADAREKLTYDLFYVKNGGLILDAAIILQTVRVVVWRQGSR